MSDLVPVESSNIRAVGYDPDAKHLTVQFHSGATHRYRDFGPAAHAALMAADSIGSHLHKFVKGKYESERVDGVE